LRITKAVCESSGSDTVKKIPSKEKGKRDTISIGMKCGAKDNQKWRFLPLLIPIKHYGCEAIKLSIQKRKELQ